MPPIPIEQSNGGIYMRDVAETVRATGISRSTIFNLIRDGKLKAVKVGARTLIRSDDLATFIARLPDARDAGRTTVRVSDVERFLASRVSEA